MKKFLAIILCLAVAFSLAACGCDNDAENATEASSEAAVNEETKEAASENEAEVKEEVVENVVEPTGVLKMGTNAAFPPYEYKEGEAIVGIDADIAAAIAKELGMELEIVDMEFDSIITAVINGGVDFGMAGMTVTEERLESVNFSESYATGVQVVIVKEGSAIKSLDDLATAKIGTQNGTTGFIYASDEYENVTGYPKGADAILALKGGEIDAVIIDNEPAKAFVAENEGLTTLKTEYAVEDYAIAVKKENTELLSNINEALYKLMADGTIDEIVAKYISAE